MGPLTSSPDDLDAWDHRPKRQEEPPLEPDEYSDEAADRAEDRWIAQRDSYYK
jgi:hypothetical protein